MNIQEFKETLNSWGQSKVPFLFWIDFEMLKPRAIRIADIKPSTVLYNINGFTNAPFSKAISVNLEFRKYPISFDAYAQKFSKVMYHLNYGDSFLTNLTTKTPIDVNCSLQKLFSACNAKYKLMVADEFLVFSPETFVQIRDQMIFSFPMKGTIDASLPNAAEIILNDQKEMAEHVTIVDLIRNDLSMVADHVRVSRFRYIDQLNTNHKNLLQVSSEVLGKLPADWNAHLGEIILNLLPAGSVSGAPKRKTCEIIAQAEQEERGYYTGIVGYFDGNSFDSGVMIRFIEQNGQRYFYRSGGGITTQSNPVTEYQEMIDKVYVPID